MYPGLKPRKSNIFRQTPSNSVADLQKGLKRAKVNLQYFHKYLSDISPNLPTQATSLVKPNGPISILWQDGADAKVLSLRLVQQDLKDYTEMTKTVLAHIKQFQQDGHPFPKEIY